MIDPAIVSPIETLERGKRSRRGREFFMKTDIDLKVEEKQLKIREPKRKLLSDADAVSKRKKLPNILSTTAENKDCNSKEGNTAPECNSATFSTPPKLKKASKIPTKVTPVPKVVTTKNNDEFISPMTEDLILASKNRTSNLPMDKKKKAIRGLVFDKRDVIKSHHDQKWKKQPTNMFLKLKNRTVPAANSVSSHQICKGKTIQVGASQQAYARVQSCGIGSNRPEEASARAQNLHTRYKLSTPSSSFSKKKSAYDKDMNPLSSRDVNFDADNHRRERPLLDVYRREKVRAIEFMNEMIGQPTMNHSVDNGVRLRSAEQDGSGLKEDRKGFMRTNSNYDKFLSNVYKVWCHINEQKIAIGKFKEVFQEIVPSLCTDDELDKYVKSYCDEGKEVMLSEGIMYNLNE